ncbi:MAG: hypothetical protein M1608_00955 [Candidatus Omnitrophica bacterium]|nr:hypothetical protein [Candidatus Omnitrophota bacterium]
MKTTSLPQTALAVVVAWSLAAILSPSAQASLIGQWKFDEGSGVTATDSAGSNNGTINGATYIAGQIGSGALQFIGTDTNDYVVVEGAGTPLELADSNYTIAWWQRWHGPNPSAMFGSTPVQRVINMDDNADHSGGYSIYLGGGVDGDGTLILAHDNGIDQSWNTGFIATTNWQHIAVVFNGTNRTVYVDGYAFASRPTAGNLVTDSDDSLVFGAYPLADGTFGQFYNGDLDDIRIYNNALSAEEVRALIPGTPTPRITITQQPSGTTVRTNAVVTFTVAAYVTGMPPDGLAYQWQKDGVDIAGATDASYIIPQATTADRGHYRVVVSQAGASQTSGDAELKVIGSADEAMIAHWTFDEGSGTTAIDSVGGFNGTLVGGVSYIPGRIGSGALQFDGIDGHVEVGGTNTVLELVGTPYTISWWAKAESGVRMITMDDGEDYSGGYSLMAFFGGVFGWTHNSNNKPQNWQPGYVPTDEWQMLTIN